RPVGITPTRECGPAGLSAGPGSSIFPSMNRRIRLIGALVTLVALSAYFSERVRAPMGLPGLDMRMAVARPDANPDAGMNHGPSDDSNAPRTDMPECPLGMAGMGSSCVPMLMPATTATTTAPFEADVVGVTSVDSL